MKKLLIVMLVALMVGCGQEEQAIEEDEKIEEEEKQVINAPIFPELELVETEYAAGFTYWYYVTAIDSEMAFEILDNWAQSEGFKKTEELGYVYGYSNEDYERDLAIIHKGEVLDYPEKIMFRINMPTE